MSPDTTARAPLGNSKRASKKDVHMRRSHFGDGRQLEGLLPGDVTCPGNRVTADVHGGASPGLVVQPNIRRVGDWHVKAGFYGSHAAQSARFDDLPGPVEGRVIAVVKGIHQHATVFGGRIRHFLRFPRVGGEGLLAQHVFAGRKRFDRPSVVERNRQRVVNGFDRRVFDDVAVAGVCDGDSVLAREVLCPGRIAGGNTRDGRAGFIGTGQDQGIRDDSRRTQNSELDHQVSWAGRLACPFSSSTRDGFGSKRIRCSSMKRGSWPQLVAVECSSQGWPITTSPGSPANPTMRPRASLIFYSFSMKRSIRLPSSWPEFRCFSQGSLFMSVSRVVLIFSGG